MEPPHALQLPHGGIDEWISGAALLPSLQQLCVLAPRDGLARRIPGLTVKVGNGQALEVRHLAEVELPQQGAGGLRVLLPLADLLQPVVEAPAADAAKLHVGRQHCGRRRGEGCGPRLRLLEAEDVGGVLQHGIQALKSGGLAAREGAGLPGLLVALLLEGRHAALPVRSLQRRTGGRRQPRWGRQRLWGLPELPGQLHHSGHGRRGLALAMIQSRARVVERVPREGAHLDAAVRGELLDGGVALERVGLRVALPEQQPRPALEERLAAAEQLAEDLLRRPAQDQQPALVPLLHLRVEVAEALEQEPVPVHAHLLGAEVGVDHEDSADMLRRGLRGLHKRCIVVKPEALAEPHDCRVGLLRLGRHSHSQGHRPKRMIHQPHSQNTHGPANCSRAPQRTEPEPVLRLLRRRVAL
mmetsp:Transcript_57512/g.178544  ORF Transcript_57512/g.178544 Transcript_57512/m.178544 type:complete len:413 (+) Transcript_57512:622-1860(+)